MNAFGGTLSPAIQRLGAVSVRLSVELGRTDMALKDVLALAEGSVVTLDKLTDELLDITANGEVIAHGEVIAQDGRFALRIVSLAGGERPSGPPPSRAPRPDTPVAEPKPPRPQPPVEPTSAPQTEAQAVQETGADPVEEPTSEPAAEAAVEQAIEPTDEAVEAPAEEPEVDALLDALDELTDAPPEDGGDEPGSDEEI